MSWFESKEKKQLKKRVEELEAALNTAALRESAILKDVKRAERELSEKSHRLLHLDFEHRRLIARYNNMVKEHNQMVDEFAYGGGGNPFTPEELKILIGLCHPDKHGGKESANKMTQKLLSMRG